MLQLILGLVRHALTFGGGWVTSQGLATNDDVTAAIAAIVTVIGFAWSVIDKWRMKKVE